MLSEKIYRKLRNVLSPETISLQRANPSLDQLLFPRLAKIRRQPTTLASIKSLEEFYHLNSLFDEQACRINASNYTEPETIERAGLSLKNSGIAVIENAFTSEEVDAYLDHAEKIADFRIGSDSVKFYDYGARPVPLIHDNFALSKLINGSIESLCKKLDQNFSDYAYLRETPIISRTLPLRENLSSAWVTGWHVDFPTEFKANLILEDINIDQTRMQAIPCSNHLFLVPGKHYDISAKKRQSMRIFNFTGKKGTLYLHRGVTLHKNVPIENSRRILWSCTYTIEKKFPKLSPQHCENFTENSKTKIDELGQDDKSRLELFLKHKQVKPASKQELSYVN